MKQVDDLNNAEYATDRTVPVQPFWADADGPRPTVLQVLPTLVQGGVERTTVDIAGAVVKAGGRALVVSAGGPMVHEITRARAEHITLPVDSKNPFVIYANIARLVKIIVENDVDIVHVRSRAPAWSAYAAAKRTGVSFVTTFHGTYSLGGRLKRRYNAIMTQGQRVIANSTFIAGHIRKNYGIKASKLKIIHRGVDLERFDAQKVSAQRVIGLADEWRLDDGLHVVMLPGRLTRWKGQTVFIKAIANLVGRGRTDIRCLLVGSDQGRKDYRKELDKLIAENGLNEIVRIVENCNDMPAAYMLTDVVVSASTDPEAFGRVVPEAQALGRPVIATDHGGARETVIPGETGWLVPPGDVEALATAIEHVLNLDENARKELAEKAVQNVRQYFSKAAMCAKTLAVYDDILQLTADPNA
ncbi:MAG: glycosyltransferase family 4 protein [Rhodospirillaceae bacterium]|nr:glycosyltransferase family 4 protein [Rhodospirillaceae bacterium]MBL6940915.1 glycosyltransferase family 4 protein [Rhodospirillales bacterium]